MRRHEMGQEFSGRLWQPWTDTGRRVPGTPGAGMPEPGSSILIRHMQKRRGLWIWEGMVKTGADQQPLFYLKHMISIKSDGDKGRGTPGIRRDVMEAALFEALQGQIKISAHIMAGMGI